MCRSVWYMHFTINILHRISYIHAYKYIIHIGTDELNLNAVLYVLSVFQCNFVVLLCLYAHLYKKNHCRLPPQPSAEQHSSNSRRKISLILIYAENEKVPHITYENGKISLFDIHILHFDKFVILNVQSLSIVFA